MNCNPSNSESVCITSEWEEAWSIFDVKDRSDIPAFFVLSLVQLHISDIVVFLVQQLDEPPQAFGGIELRKEIHVPRF